jgi:formylglycine-generating enzyme required for sulfatase activity
MTEKHFETLHILHDLPLEQRDVAHFHFDEFAATLARLIADPNTRTPLAIGISGAWGSGKTTLLRRVKEVLDEPIDPKTKKHRFANKGESFRPCKTVWFDAWKYSEEDELLVALVRVILNTMARGSLGEQLWSEILDKTAPRYDVLATFLNMFKVKFGGLEIGIDLNKYKTDTDFYKHTAFLDHFNPAFEELLARWVHGKGDFPKIDETKGVLVIFIDDLDRCLPAKTVQVLEAVKLLFDKAGCVFVLGADKKVIRESVQKHAGFGEKDAEDYLEKIIQVSFSLPLIDAQVMQGYLVGEKRAMDEDMLTRWEALVAAAEVNPRRVKAVVNEINLQWVMFKNSDERASEVNRDDFICWQALMRAASAKPAFVIQVMGFEDKERRHSFILDALKWQNGSAEEKERGKGYFSAYEDPDSSRLRAVLRRIGNFSENFTPDSLDSLIHLSALPPKVEQRIEKPEAKPAEQAREVVEAPLRKAVRMRAAPAETQEAMEKALRRAEKGLHGIPENLTEIGGIQFVRIPAGKFIMGSKEDNSLAYDDEKPQHTVNIEKDFWMAKFPLTNEQYAIHVGEGKHPVNDWKKKKNHPAVNVSWEGAMAYCKWFNGQHEDELQKHGLTLHLPTEAQWEKAARGEYGNEWPWGNDWDDKKCNNRESGPETTTPVDAYLQGESPYGVADMVGNAWEWTHTLYREYPYKAEDGRESKKDTGIRVMRGGSWSSPRNGARCAFRHGYVPDYFNVNVGFRLVLSPSSISAL